MWVSICLNGFILSVVIIGVYVVSLQHYLGVVFLSDILELKKGPDPGEVGLSCRSRTGVVVSEMNWTQIDQ